jgi:hypothetical protein
MTAALDVAITGDIVLKIDIKLNGLVNCCLLKDLYLAAKTAATQTKLT